VEVSIAGTLIGSFSPTDLVARNVILIALASDPRCWFPRFFTAYFPVHFVIGASYFPRSASG